MKNKILCACTGVCTLLALIAVCIAQIKWENEGISLGDLADAKDSTASAGIAFSVIGIILIFVLMAAAVLYVFSNKLPSGKFKDISDKYTKWSWVLAAAAAFCIIVAFSCIMSFMGDMNESIETLNKVAKSEYAKLADYYRDLGIKPEYASYYKAGAGSVMFFLFGLGACGCVASMFIPFKKTWNKITSKSNKTNTETK